MLSKTNKNKNQSLGGGYYNSVDISLDGVIPDVASVYYTHHVHSHDSTTETVVDEYFSGDRYGEDTSPTKGGCYGERYVIWSQQFTVSEDNGPSDHNKDWHNMYGRCPNCGYPSRPTSLGGRPLTVTCYNCAKYGYKTNCGYTTGQILKAEIIY